MATIRQIWNGPADHRGRNVGQPLWLLDPRMPAAVSTVRQPPVTSSTIPRFSHVLRHSMSRASPASIRYQMAPRKPLRQLVPATEEPQTNRSEAAYAAFPSTPGGEYRSASSAVKQRAISRLFTRCCPRRIRQLWALSQGPGAVEVLCVGKKVGPALPVAGACRPEKTERSQDFLAVWHRRIE